MNRNDKKPWIEGLSKSVEGAQTLVVADYRGLSVSDMTELRTKAREAGVSVKVIKNRLARLAFKGTDFEGVSPLLEGTTLIAFGDDIVSPAKVLQGFAKGNEKLSLKGGVMNAEFLDQAGVINLASMLSLDELRGKLAGLVKANAGKLAFALNVPADATEATVAEHYQKAA